MKNRLFAIVIALMSVSIGVHAQDMCNNIYLGFSIFQTPTSWEISPQVALVAFS